MLVAHAGHDHGAEVQAESDSMAEEHTEHHMETTTARSSTAPTSKSTVMYVSGGIALVAIIIGVVAWGKVGKKTAPKTSSDKSNDQA